MKMRMLAGSLVALGALLLSVPAHATGVGAAPPSLFVNGNAVELTNCREVDGTTASTCSGEIQGETFQIPQYEFLSDPDPLVSLALAVINSSATDQTFTFTAVVPVAPLGAGLFINGSISGSLTDVAGDGATLADATGAPIYAALIDGAPVRTLLDAPQSFSTTSSTTFGPATFGPEVFPGAAAAFIALQISFTLSPGDAASFTSVFNVVPVPEPGTIVLLASGVAGIAVWGRRRSS
jgi:hypothetical protein